MSRVRDFGLGNMGFSMGVSVYGVEVRVFYGVMGSSIVWVLQVSLSYGYFGGLGIEV